MRLYLKALSLHLKAELEYKSSLILSFLSQILIFFSYYFVILALFKRFDNIRGFTMYEVLLCFGVIQVGYAFNEVFARGMDKFDNLIIQGGFDRLLLRPKNIILQVLINETDFIKISRLIQAIIVLIIAINKLNIEWNIMRVITLILMILSSIILFFLIFLIMAAYCFVTVQGLEVRNVFTDGGKYMGQYPIGIFNKGIVFFFTFIIPYGFVNYYPLIYLIGKNENYLYGHSPLLVFLYLIPSILLFNLGIKKYSSVGS